MVMEHLKLWKCIGRVELPKDKNGEPFYPYLKNNMTFASDIFKGGLKTFQKLKNI